MACSDKTDLIGFLTDFSGKHGFDLIYCTYSDLVGGLALSLFVFGVLLAMYYVSDDSIVTPLVLLVLLGSVIVTQLPPAAVNLALVLLMFGVPTVVIWYLHRSRPQP